MRPPARRYAPMKVMPKEDKKQDAPKGGEKKPFRYGLSLDTPLPEKPKRKT